MYVCMYVLMFAWRELIVLLPSHDGAVEKLKCVALSACSCGSLSIAHEYNYKFASPSTSYQLN